MKKLSTWTFIVVYIMVLHIVQGEDKPSSDNGRKISAQKPNDILSDLYKVIRNIAFPNSPYSDTETAHNRFILMSPGKVLNYDDYYPGDEYTASLKKKNMSAPYALVPPSVMEKWFDLADVVVGGEVNSGDTGKSLALIYTSIISQITVKDFNLLYENVEARSNEAKKYLTEPIQNPVNVTENTTRMFLYSFYQEEYADRRLEMEEKINNARLTMPALEYEIWFKSTYQSLNAKVESAYSKWLVFGQKTLVELYKTFMDVSSATNVLEETRVVLRGSAVTSLDRTRTIYPVSFEPSNWYEYLLASDPPVTRDMLVAQKSMLQSKLDTLGDFNKGGQEKAKQITSTLKKRVDNVTQKRQKATKAAIDARNKCLGDSILNSTRGSKDSNQTDPCEKFNQGVDSAIEAYQQSEVSSEYVSASFLLNSNGHYQNYMQSKADEIRTEIAKIDEQLNNLDGDQVYLGGIAEALEFEKKGEQGLGSQWLKFDYDSEAFRIQREESSASLSATMEVPIPVIGLQTGLDMSQMKESLNSSSLRATGALLRVFIKRPWFKPSLFENPLLNFMLRDSESGKTAYVSPPPATDRELASIINSKHHNIYLMPEYVTSFLMARDVKLEFSGMDSTTVSKSLSVMVGVTATVGTKSAGVSGSVNVKRGKKSMRAHRTANGMVIEIPGAQIIGYFTQVMPQFPKEQNV